ncbi:hypothetical protein L6452_09621 [Arctium lappa]|uniref:Uncharacterized protein n=1 Tax=Arctium lappa TaxID=4217 RepID=A0ACB9DKU0_ARCLA|nr:hypothetical protein L6452_09621 [Arctium lappa]
MVIVMAMVMTLKRMGYYGFRILGNTGEGRPKFLYAINNELQLQWGLISPPPLDTIVLHLFLRSPLDSNSFSTTHLLQQISVCLLRVTVHPCSSHTGLTAFLSPQRTIYTHTTKSHRNSLRSFASLSLSKFLQILPTNHFIRLLIL